jgi:hypothetical protein
MADEVKKPWQHPPIRSPSTGEAGKWESTQGRDIFTPIADLDADAVGNDELERWLHPSPTYRSADSKPDENIDGIEEEIQKQPPPDGKIVHESSRTTPGKEIKPSLFGDPVENLESNVGKEQGYGNLDTAFTQDIGNNGVEDRDSETYIQSHTNGNKRKVDMNKINHTKVGDDIHYYVNGVEGRGIVVKMGNSYVMVAKEDGDFEDIHINDTFFVKDIILNKTWDNMDNTERFESLQKIHAPSPRFIMKSWNDLPKELQELLTKQVKKTGWTYEPGTSKDAESQDHDRTGSQQKTQYDSDIKEKREVTGNTEGIGSNARFGQNQSEKSDVELQHPGEPMLGGVSTVEEPLDAEEDYEGQTHDPKAEQFKHKESEYDAATGKKKDDGATTTDAGGFNSIYGPHSGKPGTDQKYGDKKSGITGVPDYNVNTFGINYSASKQAHPPKKEDDKDDTE